MRALALWDIDFAHISNSAILKIGRSFLSRFSTRCCLFGADPLVSTDNAALILAAASTRWKHQSSIVAIDKGQLGQLRESIFIMPDLFIWHFKLKPVDLVYKHKRAHF